MSEEHRQETGAQHETRSLTVEAACIRRAMTFSNDRSRRTDHRCRASLLLPIRQNWQNRSLYNWKTQANAPRWTRFCCENCKQIVQQNPAQCRLRDVEKLGRAYRFCGNCGANGQAGVPEEISEDASIQSNSNSARPCSKPACSHPAPVTGVLPSEKTRFSSSRRRTEGVRKSRLDR